MVSLPYGRCYNYWVRIAQAIKEGLPDGDKEKQLFQGLLNQRNEAEEAMKMNGCLTMETRRWTRLELKSAICCTP